MTLLDENFDEVRVLTLSQPEKRNPITPGVARQMIEHIEIAERSVSTRVILLCGAGGTFSSGGDLGKMPPSSAAAADARLRTYSALITRLRSSTLPIICAVEGTVAGIALGIVAACDVVVAADDSQFLVPFSRLGLFPDGGLIHGLTARIGPGRAKSALLLGDGWSAPDALAVGVVDRLVSPGRATQEAMSLARKLSTRAPLTLAHVKDVFCNNVADLDGVLAYEREVQTRLYFTDDFLEGRDAFFEKRSPEFTGH